MRAPGLAHRRLKPSDADSLLFDDVVRVENAQSDHAEFVGKLRARGVEVVEPHRLLAETVSDDEARSWLPGRKIVANEVGIGLIGATREYLEPLEPDRRDETLLMKAVYRFHPDFADSAVWWGDPERSRGRATFEGGDGTGRRSVHRLLRW